MKSKEFLITTFMIITAFWCGYILGEIKNKEKIEDMKNEVYKVEIRETQTKIKIESKTPRTFIEYSWEFWTLFELEKN